MTSYGGMSRIQSYGWIIRNIFYDAVTADPFFRDFTYKKTARLPIQREQLPFLGIYVGNENMGPDGDANATEIKFAHSVIIGFQSIIAYSDEDDAELQCDRIWWRIMHRLWEDPVIMNMLDARNPNVGNNPDNVRIESLTRGIKPPIKWGTSGHNNETPIAIMGYDVTVYYRTEWSPRITDTLNTIDVQTGVKWNETQAEWAQRWQEHVTYDLTK